LNSRFCESIRERWANGNYPPNVLDRLSWPDVEEASGNLLKLLIRMVAGYAELAERKNVFGCGGLILTDVGADGPDGS
jgi:hypothetical protein